MVPKTHVDIFRAFVDSHFGRDLTDHDNLNSGNRLQIHWSGFDYLHNLIGLLHAMISLAF